MKRIFISDIHMGSSEAVAPSSGKPYSWLDAAGAERLADFLNHPETQEADQWFLVGDLIDMWVCPMDVVPPTARDIIFAPHNAPVIDAIAKYAARPHKQVVYIPGNHDMQVTLADAQSIHPNIVFGKQYDEYPLRVRHGHEGSLFNAPDPSGRPFPIGYYITRMTATGVNRGHGDVKLDLWTILKNASEVVAFLRGTVLADCVLDTVAKACGVTWADEFVMPDRTRMSLRAAADLYQTLVQSWRAKRGDPALAIEAEWDPWYDLPTNKSHLNIVGHSHNPMFTDNPAYGVYLNTGTWCSDHQPTYARTWEEQDGDATYLCGQVCGLAPRPLDNWSSTTVQMRIR